MAYTQENFQEWIFHISDKMDEFTDEFAKENHLILDYTLASLDDLEKWILEHYSDAHELMADSKILDRLGIYIGETYRKYLGGKWVIDLKNKKMFITLCRLCRIHIIKISYVFLLCLMQLLVSVGIEEIISAGF